MIYFLHIEKTGGTSIINLIDKYLKGDSVNFSSEEKRDSIKQEKYARLFKERYLKNHHLNRKSNLGDFTYFFNRSFVTSHEFYPDLSLDIKYITYLRDPISHTYSYYNWTLKNCEKWNVKPKYDSFKDFVRNNNKIINYFCNCIGKNYSYEQAGEVMDQFYFVGIFERFEEDARTLLSKLNFPSTDIPHNNKHDYPKYVYDEETEWLIKTLRHQDYKLYNYFKNK